MTEVNDKNNIDPEWIVPEPTPIPKGGWRTEDIGREIYIRLQYGTIVPDTIVVATLGHGPDHLVVGPAHEIGGFLARIGHLQELMQATQSWVDQIREHTEEDEGGFTV